MIEDVRVLIVDDHPMIRHGLAVALRQESAVLQVEEAGNAEEAKQRYSSHSFHHVADPTTSSRSGIQEL